MKIRIKNDNLFKMLMFCQGLQGQETADPEALNTMLENLSLQERGLYILNSFFTELLTAAEENDVFLDLSYQSVRNLGPALACLYAKRFKAFEPAVNQAFLEKSLAAYLTFLCINEQGMNLGCVMMTEFDAPEEQYWAGSLSIYPGDIKANDFLPAAREAVTLTAAGGESAPGQAEDKAGESAPGQAEDKAGESTTKKEAQADSLFIEAEPLVVQFIKVAGLDLTDFGLDDFKVIIE